MNIASMFTPVVCGFQSQCKIAAMRIYPWVQIIHMETLKYSLFVGYDSVWVYELLSQIFSISNPYNYFLHSKSIMVWYIQSLGV